MFIMKAKMMGKILSNLDEGISDKRQVDFQFQMHREAMEFYVKNIDLEPTPENYQEAVEHIQDCFGLIIELDTLKSILKLFPDSKVKLAKYDGCSDTDVRDSISGAFCKFVIGSDVPTYGDKIDIDRFYKHLEEQAKEIGLKSI